MLAHKLLVMLPMQAWERTSFSAKWAQEVGLDSRGMRFARDVRRQLEAATGPVSTAL
jgi:ATP-dependent RNA helicase DHX8/PRP22